MRPRHTQHSLPSFPVYSCAFLKPRQLVLGGGGGASRSGIKNKLVIESFWTSNLITKRSISQRIYDIAENLHIELLDEYELEKGEDAPMSMASHTEVPIIQQLVWAVVFIIYQNETLVCGINSVAENLEKGENENCRTFSANGSKCGSYFLQYTQGMSLVTGLSP